MDFAACACFLSIIALTAVTVASSPASWPNQNFLMTGPKAYMMFSESVVAGRALGVEECRHQFKWDRWNCPASSISPAIREQAFLNAVNAAAVMYTLTLNCSRREMEGCSCDNTKSGSSGGPNWKWGGCSDNIGFGERISKQFVDALEESKDARAMVNLHNNEAGRRAVKKTLRLSCKCHGVSGSCSIRTCWNELADFREIGDYLKRKYFKAVMVDAQNGQLRRGYSTRKERDIPEISNNDLVYLEPSPDFCKYNSSFSTMGTVGRECSRPVVKTKDNRWERRSCQRLCDQCGLVVRTQLVNQTSTCNCKFQWCCEVKCEQCTRIIERHTCVPR